MDLKFWRLPTGKTGGKLEAGSAQLETMGAVIMVIGLALFAWTSYKIYVTAQAAAKAAHTLQQAEKTAEAISQRVRYNLSLLQREPVQQAARLALETGHSQPVEQLLKPLSESLIDLQLYQPPLDRFDAGGQGYLIYDLLLSAQIQGISPLKLIENSPERKVLAAAVRIGSMSAPEGYMLARWRASAITDLFAPLDTKELFFALQHTAGGSRFVNLVSYGDAPTGWRGTARTGINDSGLFVTIPNRPRLFVWSDHRHWVVFMIMAAVLLVTGWIWRRRALASRQHAFTQPVADLKADQTPDFEPRKTRFAEPRLEQATLLEQRVEEKVDLSAGIFRAYDIRGIVGKTLDSHIATQIGQAVGSLALERGAAKVIVGRDGRLSGPALVRGLIEGLVSSGCEVVDIGAVPTPVLYYAAHEAGSGSGVMVTGSHNPPDYNGFKVMVGGVTLSGDEIQALYQRIVSGDIASGRGTDSNDFALDRYRQRIASDIRLQRPLKVVADCGNGIAGVAAPDVLRAIGAEVYPLFDEVDGTFPNHHPDPSEPENLRELIESVKLMKADIGVAFDGDADRLGVVTAAGDIIYPDRIMMLFARDVLSRNPGAPIIYDVKCTGQLGDVIQAAGGEPMMWKTGHSLIKAKMKQENAPLAGEMSGHFFFKERWYGFDDGIYACARLLEILAAGSDSPEEVFTQLPDSVSTPELKVHMQEGENHAFIQQFQQQAEFDGAELSTIDGIRADYPDGWGLVRASNTTPVLVVRFDAGDEAALRRIQEAFRSQLLAIRPDLDLPF